MEGVPKRVNDRDREFEGQQPRFKNNLYTSSDSTSVITQSRDIQTTLL